MIEQDLRTYLLAQSGISALIGARLYPLRLPQGVIFPAVTYQRVFGTSTYAHDGPSDLGRARLQIDCWANSYEAAIGLADSVRQALSGFLGSMGSNPATASRIINVIDLPEPEPALWRRMVEIAVWHQEAV